MTPRVSPRRNDLSATNLVTRAKNGDQRAWDALVEQYAPLIWSICRRHRLNGADTHDVGQNVWLCLLDHLERIREPTALPGWLATTTRRECGRILRTTYGSHAARQVPDAWNIPDQQARTAEEQVLTAERHAAVREAFQHLSSRDQQLITLLLHDPPMRYAEISVRLEIPVGSIGPNRRRCLEKLRRHPALTVLIDTEPNRTATHTRRRTVK